MSKARETARQPFAYTVFFPAATAYSALILPWSVLGQSGWVGAPPGLHHGLGHAHEMLFGFALAVVAGYVLGPQPRRLALSLLGLWLAARIAFLGWPGSWVSGLFNTLFVALGYRVVPRFARTAKKWRNKALVPIFAGLCLAGAVFQALYLAQRPFLLHAVLAETVLLLSALMFFMSGRMLAPAVAGHLQKQGRTLEARVQPRLEGAVLILMGLVLTLNALPWPSIRFVVGVLLLIVAVIALVRLLRWPLWHCRDRPDLIAIAGGYIWLISGWLLIALALLFQALPMATAVHGLTIGAIGTLTLTVMARTYMQRFRRDTNVTPAIYLSTGLISLAALARITGGPNVIVIAALSWSLSFLCLLAFMARTSRRNPTRLHSSPSRFSRSN